MPACPCPHLALEAEDGDGKTHQRRDPQTQNHRFGVVKAERRGALSPLRSRTAGVYVTIRTYLDTNPIMKAMLRVWTDSKNECDPDGSLSWFNLHMKEVGTYKENQQNDIPWKLPPVWVKG